MAGIYIHIPFCRKACHYCDFHFSTSLAKRTEMIEAICKELLDRKAEVDEEIETIYFGGGTPSILLEEELSKILRLVYKEYSVSNNAEVTLEANPDDCTSETLEMWKHSGVNRLSIGVQSFRQEDLEWMNRSHNSTQAIDAIWNAQKAGFKSINLDLIYGIPSMPTDVWKENVTQAFALPIDHISAYSLTVEPGTALNHFIKSNQYPPLKDEKAATEFEYFQQQILKNGWEQYEISNYCKPGGYAVHNTNYWRQKPYIGVGPSAHSYLDGARRWNVSNNAKYLKAIQDSESFWQSEKLSIGDQINEYIMLGLRTKWGVDISDLQERFDYNLSVESEWEILELFERDHIKLSNGNLALTEKGKLLADNIAASLFTVE